MKILHLISSLNTGGIERWLTDINEFQSSNELHFLKQTEDIGFFEEQILSNGGHIHFINFKNKLIAFYLLFKFIKKNKFDVVHSHNHFSSGLLIFAAFLAGVKVRVTHSHLDDRIDHSGFYFVYLKIMRIFINSFSNKFIACSSEASICLFNRIQGVAIFPCGVKFREDLIGDYSFKPSHQLKICHVGRFNRQKNHDFILSSFIILLSNGINAHLYLIGSGKDMDVYRDKVLELGLDGNVTFLGNQNDVGSIMKKCDIFIFPSLFEGLGLALIEAQLYGLYCFCSENVPSAAKYGNCKSLSINEIGAEKNWADSIESMVLNPGGFKMVNVSKKILDSNVNIKNNLLVIESIYCK